MEINPRQERFDGTNSRYQTEAPSSNDHKMSYNTVNK